MAQLPAHNSTSPTANTPAVSVQAKSKEALTQAIHSPADSGFTVDRARRCLKLYYEPDMSAEDRADMLDLYEKALSAYPKWAVSKGFDQWEKTGTRRPSPGEIGILAGRAMKEITDELARRAKIETPPEPERAPPSQEEAERIMQRAGFTPKRIADIRAAPMAITFADAEAKAGAPWVAHWSEGCAADDYRMIALKKARAANALMNPPKGEA